MGLILNKKIRMLMKGYPTVSDKYNVAGGTLAGNTPVYFGQLVKFSETKGLFEAITAEVTLNKIAGFVLATNVKLNEVWPEGEVRVNPGEAFNLAINNTFMAIELAAGSTEAQIIANAQAFVKLEDGTITTPDKTAAKIVALPNVYFTGTYENIGTKDAPKYLAEIYIK